MGSKAGYVSMAFGQRRPREAGKPIELRDGERVENIQLNLPRGGVITGRITDEFGEPVAGVAVQAQRHQYIEGRQQLVPVFDSGWTGTDDLGRYRAYGLPPGEYVMHAAQNNSGMGFGTQMETRSGFAPTYYPGTASEREAQRVRVTAGAEVTANFALLTARMLRVSGTALDSQGRPITNGAIMVQEGPPGRRTSFSMSDGTMIRPDGTFTLTLPPGEYVLHANGGAGMSEEKQESGWVPITLADADVSGVSIMTMQPATLRGQVLFDGAAAPPFKPAEVAYWATPVNPTSIWFGGRPISARDDWTFEGSAQESPVVIHGGPQQQSGWHITTVMQRGVDVTDTGIVFRAGETVDDLQIVMSNRLSVVSGSVTTDRGAVAKEYSVVIFADDPNRWGPISRFIRSARPDQQGQFAVKGLPPGSYLALAIEYLEEGQDRDPEFLQEMRPYATAFQLGDAERKVLALRIARDR